MYTNTTEVEQKINNFSGYNFIFSNKKKQMRIELKETPSE